MLKACDVAFKLATGIGALQSANQNFSFVYSLE